MNKIFKPKLKQTPEQITQDLANIKSQGKEKSISFTITPENYKKVKAYQKKYNLNQANIYEHLLDQLEDID